MNELTKLMRQYSKLKAENEKLTSERDRFATEAVRLWTKMENIEANLYHWRKGRRPPRLMMKDGL